MLKKNWQTAHFPQWKFVYNVCFGPQGAIHLQTPKELQGSFPPAPLISSLLQGGKKKKKVGTGTLENFFDFDVTKLWGPQMSKSRSNLSTAVSHVYV